jgi:hypothetical protein
MSALDQLRERANKKVELRKEREKKERIAER